MAQSTRNFSIVEYYGEQRKYKCGYCKQSDSCHSHGMQAHCMTNQDYQDLIDRGWRRSGTYCYKPTNDETCCPCYTIKCDVSTFVLSKSQKKIIKKLNKFLVDGHKDRDLAVTTQNQIGEENAPMDCGHIELQRPKMEFDMDKAKDIVAQSMKEAEDASHQARKNAKSAVTVPDCSKAVSESQSNDSKIVNSSDSIPKANVHGPDASKPLRKKAKLMRMERKAQKLCANKLPNDAPKKEPKNAPKNLATLLNEVEGDTRHKLQVKLLPSDESNENVEVFNLYRNYQMVVHNDPPAKLTKQSFDRFLVNSPLKVKLLPVAGNQQKLSAEEFPLYRRYQTVIHNDDEPNASDFEEFLISSPLEPEKSSTSSTVTFGSYHQQYWLDDKLIAVGVIDILPSCVSSVYFFYDPEYSFLSLGTYGSLREIHLTQQLQQQVGSIDSYYMGFYIHSCPKMRYKGKLTGSFLLCPEAYTWHPLNDNILQRLNESKYQRLNDDQTVQDVHRFTVTDLDRIMILSRGRMLMTYPQFVEKYPRSTNYDEIFEYGQLVGRSIASRMVKVIF